MSEETSKLTLEQELARRELQDLAAPQADPAFRNRLRYAFTSGAITDSPRRLFELPWYRREAFRWLAVPAAAVAAALAVVALNQGPAWRVARVTGEGIAIVDGKPIPIGHADLAGHVRPGRRVRLPDGAEVEIVSPGAMAIQIVPGTDMTVPAAPGRWFGRATRAQVSRGELRITTGPAFQGGSLTIETPDARVEIAGTTLAVICESEGTCVCVFEGRVRVGEKHGAMVEIPEGKRRFVFNDQREPMTDEIRPMERTKLGMFHDARRHSP